MVAGSAFLYKKASFFKIFPPGKKIPAPLVATNVLSNFSKSQCAIFRCCAKYDEQKLIMCTLRTRIEYLDKNELVRTRMNTLNTHLMVFLLSNTLKYATKPIS